MTRPYSSKLDHVINRYDGVGAGRSIGPALNFANYLRRLTNQFIGAFSWNFIGPPVRFAYLIMLLAVAFVELNPKPFTIAERIILLFVFAAALIEIYVLVIALDGTYQNDHFSFWSVGVTGRYIIPFCLAGLLALKRSSFSVRSKVLDPYRPLRIDCVRIAVVGSRLEILLLVSRLHDSRARGISLMGRREIQNMRT